MGRVPYSPPVSCGGGGSPFWTVVGILFAIVVFVYALRWAIHEDRSLGEIGRGIAAEIDTFLKRRFGEGEP